MVQMKKRDGEAKKQLWGFKKVAFCACVVYAKLKGFITL
jgi:hypothetical protein